jgi:hypothetical protein
MAQLGFRKFRHAEVPPCRRGNKDARSFSSRCAASRIRLGTDKPVSFASCCRTARSWVGTRRSSLESHCMVAPTIAAPGNSHNAPHVTEIVGLTFSGQSRKRRGRRFFRRCADLLVPPPCRRSFLAARRRPCQIGISPRFAQRLAPAADGRRRVERQAVP